MIENLWGYNIKFIDLNRQYKLVKNYIEKDIVKTLDKGDFILGQKVFDLELQLAKYVGVKECVTCASGTDALLIPLMAESIGEGDVVFTTNFSFFATTEVISLVGATPVFVDINEKTFNIDPELLEIEIINTIENSKLKPRAIIAVDLFGQLADYDKIEKIAKKYNLFLIEDAAQSFGATYENKKACSFGNVAATSFYPAKPLGCYGDGGAIFTDDLELANKCRSIRVHGEGENKYDNLRLGLNSRLDTLQANVLLRKLEIFDEELDLRNKIANRYSKYLKDVVRIPYINKDTFSSWAQYSILTKDENERNKLINNLNDENIPNAIYYKKPFNELKIYENLTNIKYDISKRVSKTILSLPMHPYLSKNDQDKIINHILNFYNDWFS